MTAQGRRRRRAGWLAAAVATLVAAANLPAAAASVRAPAAFTGSCQFAGPITPKPAITVVPLPGPHFDYSGTGTCNGTLDAAPVTAAPLTVTFTNVATLFDTCELGPDFDLHGLAAIGPPGRRALFEIDVNLARLALVGPFALTTTGNGLAVGTAQFNPADPASAPQQCATTGISTASLSASFNTLTPLIGMREPPPTPVPAPAPALRPAPATRVTAPSSCGAARSTVLRLRAARGRRIVAVAIYLDGRLILQRRGRRLRSVPLPALSRGGPHTIRIVARLERGERRAELRRYRACAPR